jgi:hypothetical protein
MINQASKQTTAKLLISLANVITIAMSLKTLLPAMQLINDFHNISLLLETWRSQSSELASAKI